MNLTDYLIHEPADEYHARSRSGEYMSSHLLQKFKKSPRLYWKTISGMIEEKTSEAFLIGRATHSLILEGNRAFEKEFIVSSGPINMKTGKPFASSSQAYQEWLQTQEKDVVSPEDYENMCIYRCSVQENEDAMYILNDGVPEGVMRCNLEGIPCQIRCDWLSENTGLTDLKTTTELQFFEYDCKRFGYAFQLAFYRAVIREITGITVPVHLIAVEKSEPYSCGVWNVSDETLDNAEVDVRMCLRYYMQCKQENNYPTGYENSRILI